jgi:hypothetical protein
MSQEIEITGKVLGHARHEHFDEGGRQDYFLFADESSGLNYPLYVSSSKFHTKKTTKALISGQTVRVKGKLETTFSITPQARAVIEASDIGFKKFLLVSYTKVLVPTEVEIVDEGG